MGLKGIDKSMLEHNKARCYNGGFNYFEVLVKFQQSFPDCKVKEYLGFISLKYKTVIEEYNIQIHFPTTHYDHKANEFIVRVDGKKKENVARVVNIIRWIESTKARLALYKNLHDSLQEAYYKNDKNKIKSIELNLFINGCY